MQTLNNENNKVKYLKSEAAIDFGYLMPWITFRVLDDGKNLYVINPFDRFFLLFLPGFVWFFPHTAYMFSIDREEQAKKMLHQTDWKSKAGREGGGGIAPFALFTLLFSQKIVANNMLEGYALIVLVLVLVIAIHFILYFYIQNLIKRKFNVSILPATTKVKCVVAATNQVEDVETYKGYAIGALVFLIICFISFMGYIQDSNRLDVPTFSMITLILSGLLWYEGNYYFPKDLRIQIEDQD
ncbi:DUF443 family protein [Furfurilactobacillus entadae]|uniref:DUF443 family protein n=1 Tax=Furfurilactobacillus entadae TaxID=2922307 RepID=UPI0035F0EE06